MCAPHTAAMQANFAARLTMWLHVEASDPQCAGRQKIVQRR